MTLRHLAVAAVLCCTWIAASPAVERDLPLSEVKPGLIGIGRTAFAGTTLQDFTVRVIGVLRDITAPGRSLILARLEGGPLASTGVIAGMSGSPVYVDGRLMGAVSYSLGSFPTEAIAGITPIAEMREAAPAGRPDRTMTPVRLPSTFTPETLRQTLDLIADATAGRSTTPRWDGTAASATGDLRPIATPLHVTGLSTAARALLLDAVASRGFVAAPSAAGQVGGLPAHGLRPGDPIGVSLVSGDYNVGATGTVTDVDGTAVYAFGHPFFGLGPTRLPMTTAFVHTVLPSLQSSMKIASTGDVIGTFTQDRATVLAGSLGAGPSTIPVTVTATTAAGVRRVLRFRLSEDPFFTPLLAYVSVGSVLSAFERDLGSNTYAVRVRLDVAGHGPLEFDDVVTGQDASLAAGSAIAVPLAALFNNTLAPVTIERAAIEWQAAERIRAGTIHRIWIDTTEPRAGQTVAVKVQIRTYRGPDDVRTVPVTLPQGVDGPLTLVVSDGPSLARLEARDGHTPDAPLTLDQLVAQLRRVRRNNRLYVRLLSRDGGAVVAGEPMPALPGSVLQVLSAGQAAGGVSPMASAVVGAWDVPLDYALSGSRTTTITPLPALRRP